MASKSLARRRFRLIQVKKTLNHPTARMDGKANLSPWLADDLNFDRAGVGDAFAGIGSIGIDAFNERAASAGGAQRAMAENR